MRIDVLCYAQKVTALDPKPKSEPETQYLVQKVTADAPAIAIILPEVGILVCMQALVHVLVERCE